MSVSRQAEILSSALPAVGVGKQITFIDATSKQWYTKNNAGRYYGVDYGVSIAAQGPGFATDTYVTDSGIIIPSFGLQVRTQFKWLVSMSKTAASTATPIYTIRIGPNQTTADTARLAVTGPAQTAAADVGVLTVLLTVRSIGASGVIQGSVNIDHNGAAVGFANNNGSAVVGTSAAIDMTALAGQYVGLSINGGTSSAWTLTEVHGEAKW